MAWIDELMEKVRRDRDQPLTALARKSFRYAGELAAARVYLRTVDQVGGGVRCYGRPRIDNQGAMTIGAGTLLRSVNVPVELVTEIDAKLSIGRYTRLNYGVSVGTTASIEIGDRVRVGPYCMIIDSEFHDLYERHRRPKPRPVVIEDDVWLGAKVSVMPGVRIGRGSVVGTGAVVVDDVAPFTVVGGVPAKKLRDLDPDKFVVPEELA